MCEGCRATHSLDILESGTVRRRILRSIEWCVSYLAGERNKKVIQKKPCFFSSLKTSHEWIFFLLRYVKALQKRPRKLKTNLKKFQKFIEKNSKNPKNVFFGKKVEVS